MISPAGASRVSPGDSYESWPTISRASNGDLVILYADGTDHDPPDTGRSIMAVASSDDGETWGTPYAAHSTVDDDAVFGMGTDSSGNLLAWTRRITSGEVFSSHLIRSTDNGATWSVLSSPTLSPEPILVGPIISVETVGLMCFWHSGTESGEAGRAYGILTSDDDGATWTQTTIESPGNDSLWPVEGRLLYLGNGEVLCIARTQVSGNGLFQLESDDYGATWTKASTNITDQLQTPAAILYDGTDIDLYYYHRGNGAFRHRRAAKADVWGSPTSWPASEMIGMGSNSVRDAGYPDGVLLNDGRHGTIYYSGNTNFTGIYFLIHDPV